MSKLNEINKIESYDELSTKIPKQLCEDLLKYHEYYLDFLTKSMCKDVMVLEMIKKYYEYTDKRMVDCLRSNIRNILLSVEGVPFDTYTDMLNLHEGDVEYDKLKIYSQESE